MINTSALGETSYTYTHEDIKKTLSFNQAFVELFNPTLVNLSLDDYRLVINDNNYFFQE
jgi:hypothetical protein